MSTHERPIKDAAAEFLGKRRIAVTGVSRTPKDHGANVVYRRLRDRGYDVFAVNPDADTVEGDRCYHDLAAIAGRRRRSDHRHGPEPRHRYHS